MCKALQKRRAGHGRTAFVPGKDSRKVETESVNVIVRNPVPQCIQNTVPHYRIVAVHGIAASAEVIIITVRRKQVICFVIYAPVGNVRPLLIALRRMVEYNIEYDLDSCPVQTLNKILQLIRSQSHRCRCSIPCLRRKETYR